MQWYSWLIVMGVLIVFYVLMIVKQKRQQKQSEQILNSFKVGDRVVTHIGIYGKIKRIYNTSYGKVCILEIGEKNKVDVELDMRYIAAKDEKTQIAENDAIAPSAAPANQEPEKQAVTQKQE